MWYASHFARRYVKNYGKRTERDKELLYLREKLFEKWYAKILHFSVQQILETAIVVYINLWFNSKIYSYPRFNQTLQVCLKWNLRTTLRAPVLLSDCSGIRTRNHLVCKRSLKPFLTDKANQASRITLIEEERVISQDHVIAKAFNEYFIIIPIKNMPKEENPVSNIKNIKTTQVLSWLKLKTNPKLLNLGKLILMRPKSLSKI